MDFRTQPVNDRFVLTIGNMQCSEAMRLGAYSKLRASTPSESNHFVSRFGLIA